MHPDIVITVTEYPEIPKLKLQFTWIRPLTAHERDCCVHTVEEEKLIPTDASPEFFSEHLN
jgi:hypothetical protein